MIMQKKRGKSCIMTEENQQIIRANTYLQKYR